jgi:hypothetical protein
VPVLRSIVSNINERPSSTAVCDTSTGKVPAERLLALLVLTGAFIARFIQAKSYFLNPDEALHYLLASHNSAALTWQATQTTAHPPLFIFLLNYWHYLFPRHPGQSELLLRVPSLLAGTAACWFMYLWLRKIALGATSLLGLILAAFAPSLIELSAEIRQYALLLFFISACLYLAERAMQENSPQLMILFSLSLYGALLTHYSAVLFAFSIGVYMLVRLYPRRKESNLLATWAAGQVVALALVAYFLLTHVPHLRKIGMVQGISETWLRKSIYHRGENNLFLFPAQQTLRVFTYLFSHGFFGAVALLFFIAGIVWLLRQKNFQRNAEPTPRQLALLIVLPFVANCAAAIAGLYPYGGTRHNAYLAPFALAGVAIGITAWKPRSLSIRVLIVLLCLAFCNWFPAPPPMIRARNHQRTLMDHAVAYLSRSAPPGSILFADYQSGLLLGYYLCGHGVVEEFGPLDPYARTDCGSYTVITTQPQEWKFYATDLPRQLAGAASNFAIAPGTKMWLFDAGWITDSAPSLRKELPQFGCPEPHDFGENIVICELTVDVDYSIGTKQP